MKTKMFFATLIFASLTLFSNEICANNIAHGVRVIVIDAGHGGGKPGAHYRGVSEKDLNLKIALRLGGLIKENMPNIKVVYTRTTDKQLASSIGADLKARADIANNANGDLFISIHANATTSTSVVGVETFIMGESSRADKASERAIYAHHKEELMDMSDNATAASVRAYIDNLKHLYGDYSRDAAKCMQLNYSNYKKRNCRGVKRQPFMVLYNLDMPGILTEVGFMTNATELAYINSAKGQRDIARSLFDGVKDYVEHVQGSSSIVVLDDELGNVPEKESVGVGGVKYTIQIVAARKSMPLSSSEFKSYRNRVKEFETSGAFRYKYCCGEYGEWQDAARKLKGVKRYFPDAFIVRYQGNKIVK